MHSSQEVEAVLRLVADGWNDCQISRTTGINRRTVLDWRHGRVPGQRRLADGTAGRRPGTCPICDDVSVDEPAYAYLLGLYLGDGCISRDSRAYRLRIVQDARYPHLIELTKRAIVRVRGNPRVGTIRRVGCVEIYACWQHWPCVFPQHGPGVKHQRPTRLVGWQREIVDRYPRQLLRGLFHSDGCRTMNRVRKGRYSYPRYFFTNTSADILQIFRDACDAVGVEHRNSRPNMISVAKRESVAALDAFVGPKG
jgi:hypothetical protein